MAPELRGNVGALGLNPETRLARVRDQGIHQPRRDPPALEGARDQRVLGHAHGARGRIAQHPGQPRYLAAAGNVGVVFPDAPLVQPHDLDPFHRKILSL